ncbi:hypothetical protein Tharo_0047 [Thauera aromatica K172]|uniref:Uncharacterized protein n=1 Tax=Thauera aromatica K172 TaxID=44139 RepID=A0A2R4BI51_THAAR|nr:hypothetical protein Tharo_0047 [Thauera aromatica K172]
MWTSGEIRKSEKSMDISRTRDEVPYQPLVRPRKSFQGKGSADLSTDFGRLFTSLLFKSIEKLKNKTRDNEARGHTGRSIPDPIPKA